MKVEAFAGTVSGVIAAAAAEGPAAMASLAGLVVLATVVYCWTVASAHRTGNTVSIINALRRRTGDPPLEKAASGGRSPRRRRRSC